MGKTTYKRVKGSQSFRQRLVLATLASTPILVEDIRAEDTWPGLRPREVSLLRLIEKVCDDCVVEINETGSKLKYKPGIVMGGKNLVHDCGVTRSIGYFLEPLILIGLFAKKPISVKLKGITNDSKDPCVDTFRSTTLPMLKRFGVPSEGLELKIESRGAPPQGGGEVILTIPIVDKLMAVNWLDEGMVKRIRGVTFSTRVSSQFENTMIHAARGIFNRLLPDVHIFTDHKAGPQAGKSPGYGISLVAETTSGCFISTDTAVSYAQGEVGAIDDDEKKELMPPEDVGEQIASLLLEEIEKGGVVDSTHQGLLFLLCALCEPDVSKVRVGKLSPYGIETLRNIRDFLGVTFDIKPDPATGTVILRCVGCGYKNLSRKRS
ncbi:RNA 3'-terminal phosphate cyclase-like protein [Melia azedarach]|uniref:RNA 3'-terminal phosphate cyclase-like protein n=1 Tax=Melia azedarach TaxID=155640 RepID=A0ACC1X0S6_MELAZ|nr:RNA 3'-terminal phosphate cyclase-like protein [Melia azedarach]